MTTIYGYVGPSEISLGVESRSRSKAVHDVAIDLMTGGGFCTCEHAHYSHLNAKHCWDEETGELVQVRAATHWKSHCWHVRTAGEHLLKTAKHLTRKPTTRMARAKIERDMVRGRKR